MSFNLLPCSGLRLIVGGLLIAAAGVLQADSVAQITLTSQGIAGDTPDCHSGMFDPVYKQPAVYSSADGRYVTFASCALNLVAGQVDAALPSMGSGIAWYGDVFVQDRQSQTTALVSRAALSPTLATNNTALPAGISGDGRWVLFLSSAANLLPTPAQDSNSAHDVFLHDRQTGSTQLVSHVAGQPGTAANRASSEASLSRDGRYVVFSSTASNLVAGMTDPQMVAQVYLFDRDSGTVELVSRSLASGSVGSDGRSGVARVSADGRHVSFASLARNLVAGQTGTAGSSTEAYLRDRVAQTTVLASRIAGSTSVGGGISNYVFHQPFVSDFPADTPPLVSDTGEVFFTSVSALLLASDLTGPDAYAFNPATQVTRRISHSHDNPLRSAAGFGTYLAAVSPDGRWSLLLSYAPDLVAGQLPTDPSTPLVALHDAQSDSHTLISRASGNALQPVEGVPRFVADDGSQVVFDSAQLVQLVPGAAAVTQRNVFTWQRSTATVLLASRRNSSAELPAARGASAGALSADGQHVLYVSSDHRHDAARNDRNQSDDVLDFAPSTAQSQLRSSAGEQFPQTANGVTVLNAISADGRWLVQASVASNIADGITDDNGASDVYLYDQQLQQHLLVSRQATAPSHTANGSSGPVGLSADGRWVLFSSTATDVLAGIVDDNGGSDIFLFDRQTSQMRLVSRASDGVHSANAGSYFALLSADGRRVTFNSEASDLVAGVSDNNGFDDTFLFDVASGQVTLVSRSQAGQRTIDGFASPTAISGDGRWVLFRGYGTDLVAGGDGSTIRSGVFLYDSVQQAYSLVIQHIDAFSEDSEGLALSHDGRWILFNSSQAGLDPDVLDLNGTTDVFLRDRITGQTVLVSRSSLPGGLAGRAFSVSSRAGLSADGRIVIFNSAATDMVPGMPQFAQNSSFTFAFDRLLGTVALLSRDDFSGAPNTTFNARLSGNGSHAFFNGSSSSGVRLDLQTGNTLQVRGASGGFAYVGAATPDGRVAAVSTDSPPAVFGFRDNNGQRDSYLSRIEASPQQSWVRIAGSAPEPSSPGAVITVSVQVGGSPTVPQDGSVTVLDPLSGQQCSDGTGEAAGNGDVAFSCQLQLGQSGITGLHAVFDGSSTHPYSSTLVRHAHRVDGLDFGSAPISYGTLLADNGPRHAINSALFLGRNAPDAETDGPAADLEEDETGLPVFRRNEPTAYNVAVSASGYVNLFADFNQNGQFDLPEEHWVRDLPMQRGHSLPQLTVPSQSRTGRVVIRRRVSSAPGLTHLGPAADGEVEDGEIHIVNQPPLASNPGPLLLNEDATQFLTIVVTDGDALPGTGSVQLLSTNPSLVQSSAGTPGSVPGEWIVPLKAVPDADSGSVVMSLQAVDSAFGTDYQSFTVTLVPVNDAPTFNVAGNLFLQNGSSGASSQAGFAQNVVLGPASEAGQQVLHYTLTKLGDPNAVVNSASIDNAGVLHYVLSGNSGGASFEATLTDNGGTANGGVATSAPRYFNILVQQQAELQVTISNNSKTLTPGQAVVYEIVASNAGPHAATGLTLVNFVPAGLGSVTWTCSGVSPATCPLNAGTDSILAALNLPAGGTLRYQVNARVTGAPGTRVRNTVSLLTPLHVVDMVPGNNDASDDDLILSELLRDGFENTP